jgi:hypothetical protein
MPDPFMSMVVVNHSGHDLIIQVGASSVDVQSGDSVVIREHNTWSFSVESKTLDNKKWHYARKPFDYKRFRHSHQRYILQIEPDRRIFILPKEETQYPVLDPSRLKQPIGYPLIPIEDPEETKNERR